MRSREWDIANFQKLRCREKNHVRGVVVEGIDQASFIDINRAQPHFLCFNGTRKTGRSRPHDDDIKRLIHPYRLPDSIGSGWFDNWNMLTRIAMVSNLISNETFGGSINKSYYKRIND